MCDASACTVTEACTASVPPYAIPQPQGASGGESRLEKLCLVRCTVLTSLCLGLISEQEAALGGAGGRRGSAVAAGLLSAVGCGAPQLYDSGSGWQWPEGAPQPRSLSDPPWLQMGCVLAGLRSLRLGLSGVQVGLVGTIPRALLQEGMGMQEIPSSQQRP